MKDKIAVIGAGVSGLTIGRLLKDHADVVIYESDSRPGGLIKCERVKGSLFHTCGGHVFNTKRRDVLDFFWSLFDREKEFAKADRNSTVMFDNEFSVPYPIENHAYCFDNDTLYAIIRDVLATGCDTAAPENFEQFLRKHFGDTLYRLYFKPYNTKIWRRDLGSVPLSWLEGKLPMPSPDEIIFNNIRRVEEKKFVHSTFWYEKNGGSQLIADRMAKGLDIRYSTPVTEISRLGNRWNISGELYDKVVFCGNIKSLPEILREFPQQYAQQVSRLESHGTTSVFCEITPNPYSWIYLPNVSYDAHRIICTGNFAASNNAPGKMTATVEFTDAISEDEIINQLARIPLSPQYITHKYNPCTYPIQDSATRSLIKDIKTSLAQSGIYLTGRFADWEYYNMDVAMGAAIALTKEMLAKV